jgi:hypothetical protein
MRDDSARIVKIGDALSQLANVALLPDHRATNANESISGRAHRMGWPVADWIDALFFWQRNPGHCERAYLSDIKRAKALLAQHEGDK